MTITIECYRGAGDRDGGEVVEPLLGDSLPAALARGRAELDANAHARLRVRLTLDFAPALRLGHRVSVADPDRGQTWQGTIIGIAHAWDEAAAETRLTVERYTETQ